MGACFNLATQFPQRIRPNTLSSQMVHIRDKNRKTYSHYDSKSSHPFETRRHVLPIFRERPNNAGIKDSRQADAGEHREKIEYNSGKSFRH